MLAELAPKTQDPSERWWPLCARSRGSSIVRASGACRPSCRSSGSSGSEKVLQDSMASAGNWQATARRDSNPGWPTAFSAHAGRQHTAPGAAGPSPPCSGRPEDPAPGWPGERYSTPSLSVLAYNEILQKIAAFASLPRSDVMNALIRRSMKIKGYMARACERRWPKCGDETAEHGPERSLSSRRRARRESSHRGGSITMKALFAGATQSAGGGAARGHAARPTVIRSRSRRRLYSPMSLFDHDAGLRRSFRLVMPRKTTKGAGRRCAGRESKGRAGRQSGDAARNEGAARDAAEANSRNVPGPSRRPRDPLQAPFANS